MDVGVGAATEAGERKSLRFREGVVLLRWVVLAADWVVVRRRLLGVWAVVWDVAEKEGDFRLREGELVWAGGGSLPERMSRTLL
jgi:hypothetical protein